MRQHGPPVLPPPTMFRRALLASPQRLAMAALVSATAFAGSAVYAQSPQAMRFDCSGAVKPSGAAHVLSASSVYSGKAADATGSAFGFDLAAPPASFSGGACSSDKPFFFSAEVPDGNYRVSLVLGGAAESVTTVRAESRRLLVLEHRVPASGSFTQEFVVNVRTPTITPARGSATVATTSPQTGTAAGVGGTSTVMMAGTTESASAGPMQVKLKQREIGALDWDNKLTLEFNGEHPAVRSITITPAPSVPTLYLAGDSTVVDQDKEPWAAWGQMLPLFFGPGLSIANNAESGETIRSFVGERRLDKVMSTIKAGDFLMIQFAHNDQKTGNGYVPAQTDYKTFLKRYIADARGKGATPILVTSMNRRNFDADGHIVQTLGEYPAAMRDVAAEEHVAIVDLNALSKTLFEALGEQGTLKAFVYYPANSFPGQTAELHDSTHFNAYGAYELARAIVENVQEQHLPVAQFLRKDIPAFNPAQPDSLASWHLPASPFISTDTPYGR